MSPSLLRMSLRSLARRHWLSLLCIVGIALGVAVVVAIDLANVSAARAFTLATESVTGRATHHVVAGATGIDEDVYRRLRVEQGEQRIAPVVEDYVQVKELGRRPFHLLGVDPFAEPPFRSYLTTGENATPDAFRALLTEPNTVVLSGDVADRYGVEVGDRLTAEVGAEVTALQVVGLLHPENEYSRRALSTLLIADIATAQEVLGRIGRLSRIDVLAPGADPASPARLARIEAILPPGARVIEAWRSVGVSPAW